MSKSLAERIESVFDYLPHGPYKQERAEIADILASVRELESAGEEMLAALGEDHDDGAFEPGCPVCVAYKRLDAAISKTKGST